MSMCTSLLPSHPRALQPLPRTWRTLSSAGACSAACSVALAVSAGHRACSCYRKRAAHHLPEFNQAVMGCHDRVRAAPAQRLPHALFMVSSRS